MRGQGDLYCPDGLEHDSSCHYTRRHSCCFNVIQHHYLPQSYCVLLFGCGNKKTILLLLLLLLLYLYPVVSTSSLSGYHDYYGIRTTPLNPPIPYLNIMATTVLPPPCCVCPAPTWISWVSSVSTTLLCPSSPYLDILDKQCFHHPAVSVQPLPGYPG